MTTLPPHDEAAERLDHVAGGVGPSWPWLRISRVDGEVERQAQHRRDQQHGREGAELQRLLDEQRGQQDQHREGDREARQQVEQQRAAAAGSAPTRIASTPTRERDVAAPQDQPAAVRQRAASNRGGAVGRGHQAARRSPGRRPAPGRPASRVFVQLVAQRADRDAQDVGGVGAVAEQCVAACR